MIVLQTLKNVKETVGASLMLITHDMAVQAEVVDMLGIMYAGKIVEQGSIVHVFKEPLHPYTDKLISAFPSILGPKRELSSIHGFPPDLLNPPPGCRFHPRCNYAKEICKIEEPSTKKPGEDHYVACHLIS